jgi:hypothetical protein
MGARESRGWVGKKKVRNNSRAFVVPLRASLIFTWCVGAPTTFNIGTAKGITLSGITTRRASQINFEIRIVPADSTNAASG